ncbi:MAG: tRNA pseudouridine(38-40) synthase TruA [Spirochaetes bacterium]|nr:tRNA pseudouridine(38-40) synthase TruA [Spirochaetota bacterium]
MDSRGNKRIAAVIQYCGTEFRGFQIQKTGRTVQGEMERALKILFSETVPVVGSGRTDSGVHALYQVIHFDIPENCNLKILARSLNGILEKDVAVKEIYSVNNDFHSRYDAIEREYTYLIYNNIHRSPFFSGRAHWETSEIDITYFLKVLNYIKGTHDFSSFCKKKSSDCNNVRSIHDIILKKENNLISVVITGSSFLHNMIRIIIGTAIMMHRAGDIPEKILEIMECRTREAAGPTASACGLYLSNVKYSPELFNRSKIS